MRNRYGTGRRPVGLVTVRSAKAAKKVAFVLFVLVASATIGSKPEAQRTDSVAEKRSATTQPEATSALVSFFEGRPCVSTGRFEQSRNVEGIPVPLKSSGHFFVDCKTGVIWATRKPIEEVLVARRDGSPFLIQEQSESELRSATAKRMARLLLSLVGGDSRELERRFIIAATGENPVTKESSPLRSLESDAVQETRWVLTPKSRRVARAISHITLRHQIFTGKSAPSTHRSDDTRKVEADNPAERSARDRRTTITHTELMIEIVDQQGLTTRIQAKPLLQEHAAASCDDAQHIDQRACELLTGRAIDSSPESTGRG